MSSVEVYIVGACRTGIGSFKGQFQDVPVVDLGAAVIENLLIQTGVQANDISEVIMGQVLTAGQGQNPARQAAIKGNVSSFIPAYTINMVCGSGLKAVYLGYQGIKSGESHIVICGGQESMSLAQHSMFVRNAKYGDITLKDTILTDGLTDAFHRVHMGMTAEHLAKKHQVSRQVQDKFACDSQNKAEVAIKRGDFDKEIIPIVVPEKKLTYSGDEFPKFGTQFSKLSSLKTAFERNPEKNPTVTAGNSSGINDGAAAVMLMSKQEADCRSLKPLAKIIAFSQVGIEPMEMGIAPIAAINNLLLKCGWNVDDVDLFEINEAFAVQSVIIVDELNLNPDKVNVSGGAIALGHPIGASGARILVTLLHNLERLGKTKGIAALCIGGGMGIAIAIVRLEEQ